MKLTIKIATLILIITTFVSCENKTTTTHDHQPSITLLDEQVLTAEQQTNLTPDEVLDMLIQGNKRFRTNDLIARVHIAQVRNNITKSVECIFSAQFQLFKKQFII